MNRIFVVLVAVALLGCRDLFVSDPGGSLTVDQMSYIAVSNGAPADGERFYSFKVAARLTNRSNQTLEFPPCAGLPPFYWIYYENGAEGPYNLGCALPGGVPPFQIASGETRVDTVTVIGPTSFDPKGPQFDYQKLSGTFRLATFNTLGARYFSEPFTVSLSDGGK